MRSRAGMPGTSAAGDELQGAARAGGSVAVGEMNVRAARRVRVRASFWRRAVGD